MKDKAKSKKKTSDIVVKKWEEAIAGLPAAAKEKKVSKSLKKASRVIAKTVRDAAAKKAKANKKASKKISKKNKGKKSSKSVAKVKAVSYTHLDVYKRQVLSQSFATYAPVRSKTPQTGTTCRVIVSPPTTFTCAPTGKSGPSTSQNASAICTRPRPSTIAVSSATTRPTSAAVRRLSAG